MNAFDQRLLAELIGLARATDGNEHLITDPVTQMISEVLTVQVDNESQYAVYSAKIEAAKREMVPDCFHCANPCGRTSAADLQALEAEPQELRETKHAILGEVRTLAGSERSREMDLKLYRGLVILGLEGYSSEELTALFAGT